MSRCSSVARAVLVGRLVGTRVRVLLLSAGALGPRAASRLCWRHPAAVCRPPQWQRRSRSRRRRRRASRWQTQMVAGRARESPWTQRSPWLMSCRPRCEPLPACWVWTRRRPAALLSWQPPSSRACASCWHCCPPASSSRCCRLGRWTTRRWARQAGASRPISVFARQRTPGPFPRAAPGAACFPSVAARRPSQPTPALLVPAASRCVAAPVALPALQLAQLGEVDAALRAEYSLRRRMLIERVNVTLQSFLWSPRLEQKASRGRPVGALSGRARPHVTATPTARPRCSPLP